MFTCTTRLNLRAASTILRPSVIVTDAGFCEIDVLARAARQDSVQGVPMIRRRHQHGVDVLAVENLARVAHLSRRRREFSSRVEIRLVDIAERWSTCA